MAKTEKKREPAPVVDLSREQEAAIFRDLTDLTLAEAGRKHGLHHLIQDNVKMKFAVHKIFKKVSANPTIYGVEPSEAKEIVALVQSRSSRANKNLAPVIEREKEQEFAETLEGIRNTTATMLLRKLEKAGATNKGLDDVSFRDLKDVLAMAVDKSRLLSGRSTENILHHSKIDKNISPQEALAIVLKAREAYVEISK